MTPPQKLAMTGIIALLLGGALVGVSPLVATAEDLPERAPTDAPAPHIADDEKRCPRLPERPTARFADGKLVFEWTVQEPNPYESFIVGYPGTPVDRNARSWIDPNTNYNPGFLLPIEVEAICDSSLPRSDSGRASLNSGQSVRVPGGPEIPGDVSSLATSSTNQAAYTNSDSRADSGSGATAEAGAEGTASTAPAASAADDAATTADSTSAGTDSSAGTGADADGGRPAADTHSSAETESSSSAEAGSATHTATALEDARTDAATAGHETETPTPTTAITEAGAPKQLAETGGPGSSPLLTGIGAAFAALGGTLVVAAARRRRLEREAS